MASWLDEPPGVKLLAQVYDTLCCQFFNEWASVVTRKYDVSTPLSKVSIPQVPYLIELTIHCRVAS